MVIPKVRLLIEGLPWNTEGYERAKNILSSKFGKPSELANAHIQNILSLPVIAGKNSVQINEFYEKLMTSVQSLDTIGKLKEINGYVRSTIDKLPGIRADLVRTDSDWHCWDFGQFVEQLQQWTEKNPISFEKKPPEHQKRERAYQARQSDSKLKNCVYCNKADNKSTNCNSVTSINERRKILSDKKLCFNCTGTKHRANECKNENTCRTCKRKHHTSICEKTQDVTFNTSERNKSGTYPIVIISVDGIKCRALLDTRAGSFYTSSTIVNKLNKQPVRRDTKKIEMMLYTINFKLNIYNVTIKNLKEEFEFTTEMNAVDKDVLLNVPNPNYETIFTKYPHLTGIKMNENQTKATLAIHVILGASDFTKIKTQERPRIGQIDDPVAELTKLGWVIMSPVKESSYSNVLFGTAAINTYEELCSLDVLELSDTHHLSKPDDVVLEKFKSQLTQDENGCYQTNLIWKEGQSKLKNNKTRSLGRLKNLVRNLQQELEKFKAYNDIIKAQIEDGIV